MDSIIEASANYGSGYYQIGAGSGRAILRFSRNAVVGSGRKRPAEVLEFPGGLQKGVASGMLAARGCGWMITAPNESFVYGVNARRKPFELVQTPYTSKRAAMIAPELLQLIVCPENRTRLEVAEPELIDRVNRAIAAKSIRNRAGQEVSKPLEAGLVREDRMVLYPVVDDIPALLVDEAITLDQLER